MPPSGRFGNNTRFRKNPIAPKLSNESKLLADATSAARRFDNVANVDSVDDKMGFPRFEHGPMKVGWLINMHSTTLPSDEVLDGLAAVDYYFLDEDGGSFKATLNYDPYFFLSCKKGVETELEEYLRRILDGTLKSISRTFREDLKLPNHLVGKKRHLLQLNFHNVNDLLKARRLLMPIIEENKKRADQQESYEALEEDKGLSRDVQEYIEDIYEFDVPYHVRTAIDKSEYNGEIYDDSQANNIDIRVGLWYTVESNHGEITIEVIPGRDLRADPVVMAYDIETTKLPLKFPDASFDKVMMISYMIDGEGYLITNREIVSKDIDDFEYTPKAEFPGRFTIFNEEDEKALLIRFFDHVKEERPTVIATYNGDFFDWPFVETRAKVYGIDMFQEIGFRVDSEGEFKSSYCVHMDCFRWVKRDSYLPQGSQGLKSVTTAKLGYNPIEIDPELMTPYAQERPQIMAEYSVSDAVATYYLYMKYVHPFIFSLCTIIPLNPDEVLRKGTGTLCEMLLMVQAYENNILFPHKYTEPAERFYNGHLVESETYVGGHVESLEAGVFKSDIATSFRIDPDAIDELISDLDNALHFAIQVEGKMDLSKVTNYDKVKEEIQSALQLLKDKPNRKECPSIYHVDVASMYPNIIATNRLQPDAMVTEETCASCDFNRPGKTCDRRLPWSWRGEFLPAKKEEYLLIKNTLSTELFPGRFPNSPMRKWEDLSAGEQVKLVKKRLEDFSRKVYHRVKVTETVEREAIICQRENPFYVNTVRAFRDRRYEFKGLQKVWKKKVDVVPKGDAAAKEEAKKMVVLYDSLQLAHKVILNSFYGYVMRKGSRWYSMEMAGVTCLTGATIIQMARSLVERIGRPLELDTDGIWCILPKSFPEDFMFEFSDGKKLPFSYPCGMLNHLVHAKFTNHQYQNLSDPKSFTYETISDNSIFFEVDGPYKAMVLPTSKEEGKGLKKRYAVFNPDGSLAELKGFELKRRGELRLIKAFQSQLFSRFLDGTTLDECYASVAQVANSWLDIIDTKGKTLEEEDLMDLISENKSMSKTLEEYGSQKSTAICTAKRLAEFLGAQMVRDKGLACKYIISREPANAPVTDRAVPVAIFSAESLEKAHYLKKWLKNPSLEDFDPRNIIDWDYYRERLSSQVQKIITIPAALQGVTNPVPRVSHPDWLNRKVASYNNPLKQQNLSSYFKKSVEVSDTPDIEDFGKKNFGNGLSSKVGKVTVSKRRIGSSNVDEVIPQLPAEVPSTDNYREFLEYNKIKWNLQSITRKRRQQLFGETVGSGSGIAATIRNQNEKAYSNTWQILQYLPSATGIPGEIRAYAYINGKIQHIRINVPRKLFVNIKEDAIMPVFDIPGCEVSTSGFSLPNGHASGQLLLLQMPEDVYLKEMQNADSVFHHPSIEGVYESHILPEERALLTLGNCCVLSDTSPGLLGKGLEKGFDCDWLSATDEKYLKSAKFDYIYLSHVVYLDFQIFALFNGDKCIVYILRGTGRHGEEMLPNIAKIYSQERNKMFPIYDDDEPLNVTYESEIQVEQLAFDSASRLYTRLGSALNGINSEKGSKAILCVQSSQTNRLKKLIRPIGEFPMVEIKPSSTSLPAVGWQYACSKRLVKGYLGLESWVKHLKDYSTHCKIPLGNLKSNKLNYLIDILYARKLSQAQCVLWWSPSPIPDEGGSEKDSILPLLDPLELPVVNNPGLYSKVCLDLKISNLSINTISSASLLTESEGSELSLTSDSSGKGSNLFAENAFSLDALGVLSSLVREWWSKAIEGDQVSDSIVNSFVNWVSSPGSYLYDHALFYHVQNLSKKAFIQLISEMRRAGSKLVFADEHRFLIATGKNVVENSYSFGNYLIKNIRSKPQFQFLDMNVNEYWDTLFWMDKNNYGGRSCKEITHDNQSLDMVGHWHIRCFMPPVMQDEFDGWVGEFIALVCAARDKFKGTYGYSETATEIAGDNNEDEDESSVQSAFYASGIIQSLDQPLVKRIKQLWRRYNDGLSNPDILDQFRAPILAGSQAQKMNPVLQLIVYISAVFCLSSDLALEAQLIRRHMLEVLDMKEFSPEASFKNPSQSLKISKVICSHCNYIRDIDLCRDDDIVREINGVYGWICENCGHEYSKLMLEEKLIQEMQELVTKFQVQDLRCEKCHKIRDDWLSEYCECSGQWVETVGIKDTKNKLETFEGAARFFGFKMVLEGLELLQLA